MKKLAKKAFQYLADNKLLNAGAKRLGPHLGAQNVVAGTNIDELFVNIKRLNAHGIECTIDNLGEFVYKKEEATEAKNQILDVIERIHKEKAEAHISLKPSQLGLDIDHDFCLNNLREIMDRAAHYDIFINFDTEDHARLHQTFEVLDELAKEYDNLGTVIQAYLFEAEADTKKYKDFRLRFVKGAYKESADVSYQDKKDIDRNMIQLVEWHLLHGKFTSIATHDHTIINHLKRFIEDNNIPTDQFEFQMLYGFRENMQFELAEEGYQFCTYVPFGTDWYGYFMRRLAERPENINLLLKQVFNKQTNTVLGVAAGAFILGRLSKKNKKR